MKELFAPIAAFFGGLALRNIIPCAIILVAGSFMNFVAGFLIMLLVFSPVEAYTVPVISDFDAFSTINGAEGLQVGDTILELDGEKIYVFP